MANTIVLQAYSDYDGIAGATATAKYVNVANIQDFVTKSNSAAGAIVTLVKIKYHDGNSTRLGELWVSDAVAAINTAANAAAA